MSTPENTNEECTVRPGKIGWNELITSVIQLDIANATLEAEIQTLAEREAELQQMVQ